MSTRCNVIIKDEYTTLFFYRHSDGYPNVAGESLKKFVKGYESKMRLDAMQSAGWLIIFGHKEYADEDRASGIPFLNGSWKVGAYEPTEKLHSDAEYIYIIDLKTKTLTCRVPKGTWDWDKPSLKDTKALPKFKISFGPKA